MQLEPDPVMVYLDQWGLRRLFSLGIRRRSAVRKKRDSFTEDFYGILVSHWGTYDPKLSKKKKGEKVEELKVDEDELVDARHLSDDEASAGVDVQLSRATTDAYLVVETPKKELESLVKDLAKILEDGVSEDNLDGQACVGADLDLDEEEQQLIEQLALLRFRGHSAILASEVLWFCQI